MPYTYQGDNCYGRGDYYQGDYYQGDPGIGSFLGGLARTAFRVATGGPTGLAQEALRAIIRPRVQSLVPVARPPGTSLATIPQVAPPAFTMGPTQVAVGGFGGMNIMTNPPPGAVSPAAAQAVAVAKQCGIRGVRANKSTYITRGGGTSHWPRELLVHPRGTECVKSRRINVANPHALRRSLRRISGFAKLARRVLHFTSPRAARGAPRFKFRRRKRAA